MERKVFSITSMGKSCFIRSNWASVNGSFNLPTLGAFVSIQALNFLKFSLSGGGGSSRVRVTLPSSPLLSFPFLSFPAGTFSTVPDSSGIFSNVPEFPVWAERRAFSITSSGILTFAVCRCVRWKSPSRSSFCSRM